MTLPLQGVRVVDLSHVVAGPLASWYLAQLGAEIVKVESPRGDIMRSHREATLPGGMPPGFAAINAGKRAIAVDIRDPRGAAIVRDLAATADVFIENFRPGTVARHGLGYEALRERRADLVYCSISAYGQQGEWSGRGAYDHVVQALTGMMMVNGEADDGGDAPPVKVGFPLVDVGTGLFAALAVTAALMRRAQCGLGQYIDASMVQASVALMQPLASAFLCSGHAPRRVGNRGFSGSPGAGTWRCADGWVATAANTPRQFRRFAAVLGLESLCDDPAALDLEALDATEGGFVVARDPARIRAQLAEAIAGRSGSRLEEDLNAAGVPAARVRTLDEFLGEAMAADRVTLPLPSWMQGGLPMRTSGLGFAFADGGDAPIGPAPALGQDTTDVLLELGLGADEIAALSRDGVVHAARADEASPAPGR